VGTPCRDVQSYDVKDRGGPNTHGPEKYGREAAYLGSDTIYNDWLQSRGDAVHGTACLDSGATLFLFKSDFNPSLIAPGKATANIHGYGASMTQTGDLKGKTFMYIFDEDDPSIGDTIAPMVTTMKDANGNLASVYQMTEGPSKKSLLIQPDGAPSGFFRTEQIIEFAKDRKSIDMKTAKISGFMPVTVDHAKRQYLVKFALGSSPAEAKANAMALNDQDNGRTHYAHMAFDEISDINSTALPYGGDEFARLVNQYETDEFAHMIQNVECDITGHFGETGKTLVYENDISKRDFGDFESFEELHDFGNDTNFTGMVLDTLEKVTAELETVLLSMDKSYVLGVRKDDVHYDDYGQPWVDYSDMHDYDDMHDFAYSGNEHGEDIPDGVKDITDGVKDISAAGDVPAAGDVDAASSKLIDIEEKETKDVSAAGDASAAGDVDAASSKLIDIEESQLWILENGVPKMDYRSSDRRKNKMQVHTWCNHVGHCPGCKICIQTKGAVKKVEASKNHVCDQVIGRTQYVDAATISHKSRRGFKYALGFTDDCTGWSPDCEEQFMETRDQTIDTIIAVVNRVRTDPGLNCPNYCTRIVLDPAGEQGPEYKAGEYKLRQHGIEVVWKHTASDKRQFAKGEVQIKRKELDMKRGMLETSLEVDMWDYAWQHGIRTRNLIVRKKDAAPDGTGNPPMNQFTQNHVSVEECKRRLHYSLIPGTAALVQIPKGPIGSNVGEINRTRWGRAISQEREVVVFEDPTTRRRFRSKNFIVVKLPGGVSFFTMLGIETTAVPRSVKLRPDDVNTQVIVQLGELYKDSQAELFLQPIEGLQPYGTEKNAKMIVTAADGTVLRPDGEDSLMFRTDHKVVYEKTTDATDATPDAKDLGDIVAGGDTHHPLSKGAGDVYSNDDVDRATLIRYLQTSPQYFIGKYVYSVYDGQKDVASGKKLFRGQVLRWRLDDDNPGDFEFKIQFEADNHKTWYNNELMIYHCIDRKEGSDCSIPVLDTGRKIRKSSHNSTKSGDVSESATSTAGAVVPRCVTNQILRDLETTDSEISDEGVSTNPPKQGGLHKFPSQIGSFGNMQSKEVKSSSLGVLPSNTVGEFFYTIGGETFFDICDLLELSSRDGRVYWEWCKRHGGGNSDPERQNHHERRNRRQRCEYFPNPWSSKTSFQFLENAKLPVARGEEWERFYKLEREKMSPQETAQIAAEAKANCHEMGCSCPECLMSNEDFLKEAQEQNYWEVMIDYEELKAMRDDNEQFMECEFLPLVQVELVDMVGEDEYVNWAEQEHTHNYTDGTTGLPIPPDNVAKLLQREIQDPLWWEAIEKEINGLDEQGVYIHNLTRDQLREMGKIPDMPIVPSRMLLTVKVDSEGNFTKCKARQVLSGHKGFVKPNIHYSIVFASSPGLPATRLLQCIGICDNYTRFAFDVRQAFIQAPSEPHEQFPVAYPKGLERYLQEEGTGKFILDSRGQKIPLYMVLRKNIYGSPLASKNWAKERNNFFLNKMPDIIGGKVIQMVYESCMFMIIIEDAGVPKYSYFVVHTDDIDGIAQNPKHGQLITKACHDEWKVDVGDPRHMLGVTREISYDNQTGVGKNHLTLTGFVEKLWAKFGHHRKGKKVNNLPFPQGESCSPLGEDGKPIKIGQVEKQTYIDLGFRELTGGLLWPIRNAYPAHSFAVSQLCKLMQSPCEKAWLCALQCLHHLYEHRNDGITYRSDCSLVPIAHYDSSHNDRKELHKSHYGFDVCMGGGRIIFASRGHKIPAKSAAEDEYMTAFHCAIWCVWLRHLLIEMHYGILVAEPTVMVGDNQQATTWAHEHIITDGNRFIERDFFKLRDFVNRGYVDPRWRSGKDNPADVYTKAVSKETWDHLYRWFNDSTRMPGPPSARTALLKEQRSDDQNNRDLAESAFFSNVDLIGTGRDEQIANVEWQISQSFPSGYTWNYQGFEDSRSEVFSEPSDAAYVLEILERDPFENPGM